MAQTLNIILNNFSKGEFSDRITGRVDIPGYYQGCKTMENVIMVGQGGAESRPGTIYVGNPKYSNKKCRLIPFDVTDAESFILEVGDLYLRVWKNDVLLTTIYGGGSEFITSYLEADLFEIQYVQTEGVMYFTHLGYNVAKISYDGTSWLWDATVTFVDSPWTAPGEYPAACTFSGQRFMAGGSEKEPQTIWASEIGNYEVMTQPDPPLAADAYEFTVASDKPSQLRWLLDKDVILAGAKSSELLIAQGVSASNVQITRQSAYGSAAINAIAISDAVIFLQRGRRKIREFVYSNDNQTYQAPDLTFFADHITESGIIEYDYQQAPDPILWCVREDGVLIGMTYDRIMGVAGWHRHITDGEVESVAVLPGQSEEDEVYITVKRNVLGSDVRYIERFNKRDFGTIAEAIFCDSSVTAVGAGINEVTGLDHLNGETVTILADGIVHPDQVVVGGKITLLSGTATTITAGLPFTATLTPVSVEVPGSPTMGTTRNITETFLRLYKTQGGKIGVNEDYVDIPYEDSDLYTGDARVAIDSDYREKMEITIKQTEPLPLTVLAMVVEISYQK